MDFPFLFRINKSAAGPYMRTPAISKGRGYSREGILRLSWTSLKQPSLPTPEGAARCSLHMVIC
jgi:hypothetical protein